jgi:lipoprotein-releasing system permease protein
VRRSLEWFVARRYLASRRKGRFLSLITLIAVGGITVGVMALITVIAVMTGLQRTLQASILGSSPHVYVFEAGQGFRLGRWQQLLEKVQARADVVSAGPFVMTQVGVLRDINYAQTGVLYGIDPTLAPVPMTVVEERIREGTLAFRPTAGLPGIIVGAGLAAKLGVVAGDTVVVAALENIRLDSFGVPSPAIRQFEVTGIVRTGMYEYDNQNLYTELAPAQDLLGLARDTVSGLAVNVADPWQADVIAGRLYADLGPPYWTDNWMKLNASLFSALKLEKLAMGVILFLIVLVAAFNIISTLIMVAADKTREIGILKAMGMTDRMVLRIFVLQGVAIGLIGTALGAIGGIALVNLLDRYQLVDLPPDVYFIETLPVALDVRDFVMIVLASMVIAFVATIYPARQAARLMPVEAIRHD